MDTNMAVEGYRKYRGGTVHRTIYINNQPIRVLSKNDDSGALYRVKREFSLDAEELDKQYRVEPFDAILLSISGKDYPGFYIISQKDLMNKMNKKQVSFKMREKYYARLDDWNRLKIIDIDYYTRLNETKKWASNIEDLVINRELSNLKDDSDQERFNDEHRRGVYGNQKIIAA